MVSQYENNQQITKIKDVIVKADLINMFKRLGITRGMIVYVESSLIDYTYINGGNQCIIDALKEVLTYEGTIVSNAFSEQLVDPACSKEYLFERDSFEEMRNSMTYFHKKRTQTNNAFSEQLMKNDAVYRSNHPLHSCVAWGKYAKLICDKHPLHFSLGKDSFLDKICSMNGYVLMLGTLYKDCDIFKYASSMCDKRNIKIVTCPIEKKGFVEWIHILECEYQMKDISHVKTMLEERKVVNDSFIGSAHCRFFKAKEASVLAQGYLNSFQ